MTLEAATYSELQVRSIDAARYPSLASVPVVITGGASGIGMYLVEHFCQQGCRVGFLDIDAQGARRVIEHCAEIEAATPVFTHCDLTDIDALRAGIGELTHSIGEPQVLINNAGNDDRLPAEAITADYWDERMAVNLRHQFFAIQAVLPGMRNAGGGSIINMGSNSWMQGAPGLIAYTTAKSAVQGMTRSLARELGEQRVRVNSIAPGWILTERQVSRAKAIYQDKFDDYLQRQCLKEFLLPPDVARMALWLAADDSRMVTGQTFIVDGGVV